jgi:mRNA interferase RelE/StbE
MLQKIKTFLSGISQLQKIISKISTGETKKFQLNRKNNKYLENKSKEIENRNDNLLNLIKEIDVSTEWTTSNGRRSFKLETLAPTELLTIEANGDIDLRDLHFDPNEVATEDSIYTIEHNYRGIWRITDTPNHDNTLYFPSRVITRAPDEGHYSLLLTKNFRKSLGGISTEYQKRILSAISEISANPFFAHGNTVKPLTHQEGLWRRRVGDYRIVYSPIKSENTVMLLKVAHRKSVYQDH